MKNWSKLPKLADIYTGGQVICAIILIGMSYFRIHINYATITLILMNACNAGAHYCTYISPPRRRNDVSSYDYWLELAPRIDFCVAVFSAYATFDYTDQMISHDLAYIGVTVIVTVCAILQCILYEYDGFGCNLVEKRPNLADNIIGFRRALYILCIFFNMLLYIQCTTFSNRIRIPLAILVCAGDVLCIFANRKPIQRSDDAV